MNTYTLTEELKFGIEDFVRANMTARNRSQVQAILADLKTLATLTPNIEPDRGLVEDILQHDRDYFGHGIDPDEAWAESLAHRLASRFGGGWIAVTVWGELPELFQRVEIVTKDAEDERIMDFAHYNGIDRTKPLFLGEGGKRIKATFWRDPGPLPTPPEVKP